MTTIAWDGRVLAADGLVVCDDDVAANREAKIWRRNGWLYGLAGDCSIHDELIEWHQSGASAADLPCSPNGAHALSWTLICIGPKNQRHWISSTNGRRHRIEGKYFSLGSGRSFAIGALAAGADARTAVKIASRLDTNTGGRITSLTLETNASKRRKPKKTKRRPAKKVRINGLAHMAHMAKMANMDKCRAN